MKESQTFLLEVQQKMRSVEGVKNEVDRQRKYGKFALIVTLITGVVVGALGVTLAYMHPFNTDAISSGIISDIRLFLYTYKQHLLLPIAVCASCLGILLARQKAV